MRAAFIFLICAAASLGCAQDWARKIFENSPRHQEWVEVKNGPRTVKCFVVYPQRKDKATVVVLIHEIFGLTDWAMSVADQLAEQGYIAIAPDLLSGMAPNGGRSKDFAAVQDAMEAVSGLKPEQVTGDLSAVCDYAKTIPSANGKLAVAGFCWGGGQSFRFATNRADLSAAFVFYGGPPAADAMSAIRAPVYGFYGGNDNRVSATVPTATANMKAAGKKYEPVIYEGAGHGFMRSGEDPAGKEGDRTARDAAWKRVLEVLKGIWK